MQSLFPELDDPSEDIAPAPDIPFKDRLKAFREERALTRSALAAELGVTDITLYRWETGSAKPSPLAVGQLQLLGLVVHPSDTNATSVPRIRRTSGSLHNVAAQILATSGRLVNVASTEVRLLPGPYVRNGPPDQQAFHDTLIDGQLSSSLSLADLAPRLSLIESVGGFGTTAQFRLERPRPTAMAWNSNYGPHGWHRYVGRFPPHLVRALLNQFGADSGSTVLDPFSGSGTTATECRLLGIPSISIEICPLSSMMTRVKAGFPLTSTDLKDLASRYSAFHADRWRHTAGLGSEGCLTHEIVLNRVGNPVPHFANVERWFTPEALLGVSIAVEFALTLEGYPREFFLLALSSKMRSIGNVDVDVVRAEYSRTPRTSVDVHHLTSRQLAKMLVDIANSVRSHEGIISSAESARVIEASVLDVDLSEQSVDYVITSPPYGVEAISYLRTHLLSYRSLVSHLGHDPYSTRDKTIGSEYLPTSLSQSPHPSIAASISCANFFGEMPSRTSDSKYLSRHSAMIQFFDDMLELGQRLSRWVRDNGKVAFVVGNKRLGEKIIPTDTIVAELFSNHGFQLEGTIRHKLKTNNSNSQVPWQERVIQDEAVLMFRRIPRKSS